MEKIELKNLILELNEENNLKLEDLFPKSVLYKGQKRDEIISNNKIITSTNNKNKKEYKFKNNLNQIELLLNENSETVFDILIRDNLLIACGGPNIKIYNLNVISSISDCITFYQEEEDFYTISYTKIENNNENSLLKYLAAGGKKSIIKIINLEDREEYDLLGHRNEIYDLKFCPIKDKSFLLLSASQDFSIRLWNVITKLQICIFGGPNGGHNAEVNSIDWHLSGEYFVSSGIDYYIKIWEINEQIKKKIEISKMNSKTKFKTLLKTEPIFSCNTIHDNYVDCVKFNGNFILSKSVDGIIYEFLPNFNKESDHFYLINTYQYPSQEKIWYVKFDFSLKNNLIAVGNTEGKLSIFNLNEEDNNDHDMNYFNLHKPFHVIDTQNESLIRCVSFEENGKFCTFGDNDGRIYLYKIINNN